MSQQPEKGMKLSEAAQALLNQHGIKAAPVPIERIAKSLRSTRGIRPARR